MLIILYVIIDYFIITLNDLACTSAQYSFLRLLEKAATKLHSPQLHWLQLAVNASLLISICFQWHDKPGIYITSTSSLASLAIRLFANNWVLIIHRMCLVPKFLSPNFNIHLSHQIFCLMHGALNVGK